MNLFIEFSPKENVCQELGSLPLDALSVPDKFYWIDIEEKNVTEEHEVFKILNIKKSSLINYTSDNPSPLCEQTEHYMNLDMLGFKSDGEKLSSCKLKVILGGNFFITVHEEPQGILDKLKEEYHSNFLIAGKSPGFLVFLIFDFFIGSVLLILYSLHREMDEIEGEISRGNFTQKTLHSIFRIRKSILQIKKSVEPASNILMSISSRKIPFISDECRSFLKNLDGNMNRLRLDLDSFRELIIGTMEFHMSIASKQMNEVMKVLSIVATIMMPLTFIAGVYGMNFANMPELSWPYGYYAVLGSMGIISISLFSLFKIKKWI